MCDSFYTESERTVIVHLQCVASVVMCGLVPEGLTQKKRALVVDLVPMFAVAHFQGWLNVTEALLVPQVDLQARREKHWAPSTRAKQLFRVRRALVSGYLVVDRSSVGAVEFMISSHHVCQVRVPLTLQSLRRVTLLTQVPGITCM